MGRDGAGASTIQSHLTHAFFTPDGVDHFQRAGDQFQLLRADFDELFHIATEFWASGFSWLQPVYLAGKIFSESTTVM